MLQPFISIVVSFLLVAIGMTIGIRFGGPNPKVWSIWDKIGFSLVILGCILFGGSLLWFVVELFKWIISLL